MRIQPDAPQIGPHTRGGGVKVGTFTAKRYSPQRYSPYCSLRGYRGRSTRWGGPGAAQHDTACHIKSHPQMAVVHLRRNLTHPVGGGPGAVQHGYRPGQHIILLFAGCFFDVCSDYRLQTCSLSKPAMAAHHRISITPTCPILPTLTC